MTHTERYLKRIEELELRFQAARLVAAHSWVKHPRWDIPKTELERENFVDAEIEQEVKRMKEGKA